MTNGERRNTHAACRCRCARPDGCAPAARSCVQASFFHILSFFPDDRHVIVAAARWITVKRKLLFWMAGIRENGEDVKEGLLRRVESNAAARRRAHQLRTAPLSLLTLATKGGKSDVGTLLREFALNSSGHTDDAVTGVASAASSGTDDGVGAMSSASTSGWGPSGAAPVLQTPAAEPRFAFGAGAGAGATVGSAAGKYAVGGDDGSGVASSGARRGSTSGGGRLQHPLLTPKTDEAQAQSDIARLMSLDDGE